MKTYKFIAVLSVSWWQCVSDCYSESAWKNCNCRDTFFETHMTSP